MIREARLDKIDVKFETLTISHEVETKRLAEALFSEDEIDAVIRCHFELERAAIHALEVITQGRWKAGRSNYLKDKLNLLEIIAVPRHLLAPANLLNQHRNDLAHKGVDKITEQQEAEFTRLTRVALPQYHDDYSLKVSGKRTFDKKYRECSVKERYVMTAGVVVMLVGGLPEILAGYYSQAAELKNAGLGEAPVPSQVPA